MVKTYITMISLQGQGDLLKVRYNPSGFELKNNRETSFPIIPIIAESYESGEEIKVIAIRSDNTDTPDNYKIFLDELAALGIPEEQVREISVMENQSRALGVKLLLTILDEIPTDSIVYADITFGTKPMSGLLLSAMSFIEKIKDTEVEGIYYGEIPRENKMPVIEKAALYDLTAYKLIGDMVDCLNGLDVPDPQEALHRIMDL